ncbi:MAG: DNA mismatch repair endonuclease MutL [bacterium]
MPPIHILPDSLINKIAAGEVVERPASVVKELVENSLDAGSSEIYLKIELGGKKRIRVMDNGSGMSSDDLLLSIERHATSKIEKEDDLWNIRSMGFRGEAMPSIAAVSRMNIISSESGAQGGNCLKIAGGKVLDFSPAAAPPGTDVEVNQLFYNVPVRKKFLKTTNTELQHVLRVVSRLAISRPGIQFKLEHGSRVLINVPKKQRLIDRVAGIYGTNLSRQLLEVSGSLAQVKVSGFLGKLEAARTGRSEQLTYINGRYVKDNVVSKAVYSAYGSLLPKGRHPLWIIFIKVDPTILDVNVHPTKTEVRIADYNSVYQAILEILDRTLRKVNLAPELFMTGRTSPPHGEKRQLPPKKTGAPFRYVHNDSGLSEKPVSQADLRPSSESSEAVKKSLKEFFERVKTTDNQPKISVRKEEVAVSSLERVPNENKACSPRNSERAFPGTASCHPADGSGGPSPARTDESKGFFRSLKLIGQFAGCFLLCQSGEELVVIDQHAAHERIRFEKIKKAFGERKVIGQALLFPAVLEFPPDKSLIMEKNMETFNRFGFNVSHFGKTTFMVRQLPVDVDCSDVKKLVYELVDALAAGGSAASSLENTRDELIARLACHSSVRANKELSEKEVDSLLEQMDRADQPYTCPHGRPTVVRVSQGEVRKWFLR